MISIELATNDDFASLADLWERSVRATHLFMTSEDAVAMRNLVQFKYLSKILVHKAVQDDIIVGFTAIEENRLELLFVDPTVLGKGIGKYLLQHAITKFGIDELDVFEQNTPALGFYEHYNFKTCSRMERDRNDFPYPLVIMKLYKD